MPKNAKTSVILNFSDNTWQVENCMEDAVQMKRDPSDNPTTICTIEKSDLDLKLQCDDKEVGRLSFHASNRADCVKAWVGLARSNLTFDSFESNDYFRINPGKLINRFS